MYKSCPISNYKIDSHIVRFISFQVSIVALLLIITKLPVFAFVLFFDFTLRALRVQNLSPFFTTSKLAVKLLHLRAKMCDEAPKRFALFMGLLISLSLSILYLENFEVIATATASILLICALLETIFDFCVGCKIYQFLRFIKR